jgi:hypothetical protein
MNVGEGQFYRQMKLKGIFLLSKKQQRERNMAGANYLTVCEHLMFLETQGTKLTPRCWQQPKMVTDVQHSSEKNEAHYEGG